jgi:murein DD-endopeptidase MepM/ murein hydrolase activator NlpD
MRSVLALVILALASSTTYAAPPPSVILINRVLDEANDVHDLGMLTTEPVERTESSGYGWREDPINKRAKFHHGTDYRGKRGTPVLAAGKGTVIFAGRRGGYGRVVFIDHGNGIITRYAHLDRIDVKVGDPMLAGMQLGKLGSSGRTTGAHLHFEVRLDGRSVDPNTAMVVAALWRENPAAARFASLALAPEVQEQSHDAESRDVRPERRGRAKRQLVLW